jgi:hypothetical protein
MSKKPIEKIKALPRTGVIWLIIINFAFMVLIYHYSDSIWGWTQGDLSDGLPPDIFDAFAILQLLFFALTIDQIVRRTAINFNNLSDEKQIPKLIVQVLSIIIFVFFWFYWFCHTL